MAAKALLRLGGCYEKQGNEEASKTGLDAKVSHLAWSPDGKTLVFGGYTGGVPELCLIEDFSAARESGEITG